MGGESILQVPLYTATSAWRKEAQLRGLLRNHPSVIASSGPLAAAGTVFGTARLALHNKENVLAVGLNPLGGGGSVGMMMSSSGIEPMLEGAMRMRWLDMEPDMSLSSIDWCDELLLVGSTRSRIFLVDANPRDVGESSGALRPTRCLLSDDTQQMVGDIVVTPGTHAASTLVRSVHCNVGVNPSSVVAVVDNRAMVWDMEGDVYPVRSFGTPGADASSQRDVFLFAHWAPRSDSVVLSGSYDGRLVLTDTRCNGSDRAASSLALPMRRGYMVGCADFNALLPFVLAAASSDGVISVFDCRFPRSPVRTIPSLQGDVASLKWLKLQPDLLATGGIDGTVALWNLQQPPTYCVGRAQYKYPVFDLATTISSVEQRVFGLTCGGELTLTGLVQPALMALATSVTDQVRQQQQQSQQAHVVEDAPHLQDRERRGIGLLYARQLREAYEIIVDCAMERFRRKHTAIAMALVGLMDVMVIPGFDYAETIKEQAQCDFGGDVTPHYQCLHAFEELLLRSSERLCITLPLQQIRDLMKPNLEDLKKLEALRLNLLLQRVLSTGDVETVIGGLQLFAANAGNLDLVDTETACNIATMLLRENHAEGEKFVHTLLSLLIQSDGTVVARTLARRLLIAVQEPLMTAGLPSRQARRYEERFFRNLIAAQEAVEVQLEIQRMGIEKYRQVIATVNNYQKRSLEKGERGIFGWLAVSPLLLFLHSLTADSNYATFFWACVQLMDVFAPCPGVRKIEAVLFGTVDRIHNTAHRIREEVQQAASTTHFSPPVLREVGKTLSTVSDFLVVLLLVQLECENVAIESKMADLPPVMARIFDILSSSSSDLLEAWATLLDVLRECSLRDFVRRCCCGPVRDFSFKVEELMSVSAKKEDDEMMNEILNTCDDFIQAVSGHSD